MSRSMSFVWLGKEGDGGAAWTALMAPLAVVLPLADAPNPAFCAHHHCAYTSASGVIVAVVVAVVVLALVAVIGWRLIIRRRRA